MSWNWNEDIEEKEFENKGTVTISTEEYRYMISEVYRLQVAGQKEHDDWYKEYSRANDLEKKVKALEAKISDYESWIDSGEGLGPGLSLRSMYKQWKFDRLEEAQKDE